ncbi:hypothetical protein [uncultured Amphritea sp.]|uniref:hypothetical protein n=1 Tax=uncultured Amphritea sp. TaxID=981605 RepID=UPI0025D0157C|nr:hypothetical protein [uncultured Amphritea sp.]
MSDVWTQFESLLEKDSTQIATIISTDGTESVVELLSGDRVKIIGTAPPVRMYTSKEAK